MKMTAQQLQTMIAAVVAQSLGGKAPKKAGKPTKSGGKGQTPKGAEFEVALIEAAKKRGFANPEPRFNILTYGKWLEKGRRVRKGEKALVVAGRKTMLFHEAQTDVEGVVEPPKAQAEAVAGTVPQTTH